MINTIGHVTVGAALVLSVLGTVLAYRTSASWNPRLWDAVRRAAYGVFFLALAANLAMVYALVTHDFSVDYVARVGSRSTPVFYTVISLWSSLEGSILFWGLILGGYTAAVVYIYRNRHLDLMPSVTGTLLLVNIFFWLLIAWPADPFGRVFPVPADGPGPNPLLQNHPFMGLHPPLLYLGYVGMSVPFAFGVGALITGRVAGNDWVRAVRRWIMAPWIFLTVGIVAGGWWAYEVLGWGGYWAWDPVENASFLPWLTATAFLHSVMVQERRQMLAMWNVSLVIATFLLTLFGTFLTRSGIIGSVHAFTEGLIGPFFLGFIAIVLVASLALIAWRSDDLTGRATLDSLASRETAFMVNNLLFVAFTFTVLLGTTYPLVAEAVRGVQVSVGAPYFNRMSIPIALALIFLLGVGPALPWRRGSPDLLARKFIWPGLVALLSGIVLWLLGLRHTLTLLTLVLAVLAVGLIVGEFWRPAAARGKTHGEGPLEAVRNVMFKNRRRYGGYIVHLGVVVLAVGIALSSSYRSERQVTLAPGEVTTYKDFSLRLDSLYAGREPHRDYVVAALSVQDGPGAPVERMFPRMNYYPNSQQPIGTPSVRTRPSEDLYLTLMAYANDGSTATLNVIVNPMVVWIWIGGGIIALGALFAISMRAGRRRGVLTEAEERVSRGEAIEPALSSGD